MQKKDRYPIAGTGYVPIPMYSCNGDKIPA